MNQAADIDTLVGLMAEDESLGQHIPLDRIAVDTHQPRTEFDPVALVQLTDSIIAQGVIQPILVRPNPEVPGHYIIVAGERRFTAAGGAGLKDIPAIVRDVTGAQITAIQLIENIDREPLSALDEARAIDAMIQAGSSGADVARLMGKSESWVSKRKKVAGSVELLEPFRGRTNDLELLGLLVDLNTLSPTHFANFAEGRQEPTRDLVKFVLGNLRTLGDWRERQNEPELPGIPPRPRLPEPDDDLDDSGTDPEDPGRPTQTWSPRGEDDPAPRPAAERPQDRPAPPKAANTEQAQARDLEIYLTDAVGFKCEIFAQGPGSVHICFRAQDLEAVRGLAALVKAGKEAR